MTQNQNNQNQGNEVAVSPGNQPGIAVKSQANNLLQSIELDPNSIPDLDDAEVLPIDLLANYWTPENKGEKKRVYFDSIKTRQVVPDPKDPEVVADLPVAFFYEKSKGEIKTVCNASKRLIAVIENTGMQRGTAIEIEYLGKKKNSTNEFKSDDWSVKPLILKAKQNG